MYLKFNKGALGLILITALYILPVNLTAIAEESISEQDNSSQAKHKIKEGRKARIETIKTLKARGKVGENNKAELQVRPDVEVDDDTLALIEQENQDRKTVHKKVLEQTNSDNDAGMAVIQGLQTGLELNKSKSGDWIQVPEDEAEYERFEKSKAGRKFKKTPKAGEWVQIP